MFIVSLFITAKYVKCLSVGAMRHKTWHGYTMGDHLAMKRNEVGKHATT